LPGKNREVRCRTEIYGLRFSLAARCDHSKAECRRYRKRKWCDRNPLFSKPRSAAKTQTGAYGSPH
jgi:hypothetical protein